ncbi:MAG: hypothetical protein SFY32_00125 [Bacteroidota bacterium]|nr:hypothetical protein [Bacteroidota bacterium]
MNFLLKSLIILAVLLLAIDCKNTDTENRPKSINYNVNHHLSYMQFFKNNSDSSIGKYVVGDSITISRISCLFKPGFSNPSCEGEVKDIFILKEFRLQVINNEIYYLDIDYNLQISRYQQPWYNSPNFKLPNFPNGKYSGTCIVSSDSISFTNLELNNLGFVTLIPQIIGEGIILNKFSKISFKGDSLIMFTKTKTLKKVKFLFIK